MYYAILVIAALVTCGISLGTTFPSADPATPASSIPAGGSAQTDEARDLTPKVDPADLAELVAGNTKFAVDLYGVLGQGEKNLLFSPHSISIALAMTDAGAKGRTETQIANALHFTLPQDRLHRAFSALGLVLAKRGQDSAEGGFQLAMANRIWGQQSYSFLPEYLDTLAVNYGAGLAQLDFASDPDGSRTTINDWVSDQTEDRIKDLIRQRGITRETSIVLTNAVYFKADWQKPFESGLTRPEPFHLTGGTTVNANMMRQTAVFAYASGTDYQAVQLPYMGGQVAMVIFLPAQGKLEQFARRLGQKGLAGILGQLDSTVRVSLRMPTFTFESTPEIKPALQQLGIVDAFSRAAADFSGMSGKRDLFISDVLHKAFVKVAEKGTEAAAASAVVVSRGIMGDAAQPATVEMTVDRPFLFLIRDVPTGAILFMGRVMDPS